MIRSVLSLVLALSVLPAQHASALHGFCGTISEQRHTTRPHFHLTAAPHEHHHRGGHSHNHDEPERPASEVSPEQHHHDGDAVYLTDVDVVLGVRLKLDDRSACPACEACFAPQEFERFRADPCPAAIGVERGPAFDGAPARPLYLVQMSLSI